MNYSISQHKCRFRKYFLKQPRTLNREAKHLCSVNISNSIIKVINDRYTSNKSSSKECGVLSRICLYLATEQEVNLGPLISYLLHTRKDAHTGAHAMPHLLVPMTVSLKSAVNKFVIILEEITFNILLFLVLVGNSKYTSPISSTDMDLVRLYCTLRCNKYFTHSDLKLLQEYKDYHKSLSGTINMGLMSLFFNGCDTSGVFTIQFFIHTFMPILQEYKLHIDALPMCLLLELDNLKKICINLTASDRIFQRCNYPIISFIVKDQIPTPKDDIMLFIRVVSEDDLETTFKPKKFTSGNNSVYIHEINDLERASIELQYIYYSLNSNLRRVLMNFLMTNGDSTVDTSRTYLLLILLIHGGWFYLHNESIGTGSLRDWFCFKTLNNITSPIIELISQYHSGIRNEYGIDNGIHSGYDVDVIVLLPAAALSLDKERLGKGGGYYDIFLRYSSQSAFKIGVCFDCQLFKGSKDQLDSINTGHDTTYTIFPVEAHDVKVDYVITEEAIIY